MGISFIFMYEKASLGISFIFLLTKMGHEKQIITNNNNHRTRLKPTRIVFSKYRTKQPGNKQLFFQSINQGPPLMSLLKYLCIPRKKKFKQDTLKLFNFCILDLCRSVSKKRAHVHARTLTHTHIKRENKRDISTCKVYMPL